MSITNLILVAVLAHCSDFSSKLDIPLRLPLTTNGVQQINIMATYPSLDVFVLLTNNYRFRYQKGQVFSFTSPQAFRTGTRFPNTNDFKAMATVTRDEALALARQSIVKLGHSIDGFYMNLIPDMEQPFGLPNYYRFTWKVPNSEWSATEIEVDGVSGRLVYFFSSIIAKQRAPEPDIPGLKELAESERQKLFLQYPTLKLEHVKTDDFRVTEALPKIKAFARKLALPMNGPELSGDVEKARISYYDGYPQLLLNLTNRYRFFYNMDTKKVEGFNSGKSFFADPHPDLKIYRGEWKMSQSAALEMTKIAVRKLGYDMDDLFAKNPEIEKPKINGGIVVPHISLAWKRIKNGRLEKGVEAEIDAGERQFVYLKITN